MHGKNTPAPKLTYTIQNVVSTFNASVRFLNLSTLCGELNWCQMNPEVFAALIGRLEDPKTTILAFTSANNVCTGAKSEIDSRIACRMFLSAMQKIGIECSLSKFVIQNIVASANTGFPLRLDAIAAKYSPDAFYDPAVFPGLIYRMREMLIVFLVFREGNIVITGGKDREQITAATDIFYSRMLLPYIDDSETLNYITTEKPVNLSCVFEEVVKKFGELADADDLINNMDDTMDADDNMQYIVSNLDAYERVYNNV